MGSLITNSLKHRSSPGSPFLLHFAPPVLPWCCLTAPFEATMLPFDYGCSSHVHKLGKSSSHRVRREAKTSLQQLCRDGERKESCHCPASLSWPCERSPAWPWKRNLRNRTTRGILETNLRQQSPALAFALQLTRARRATPEGGFPIGPHG